MNLADYIEPCQWDHADDADPKHYLYALMDSDDELLYVGRSKHLAHRIYQHRQKLWWTQVAQVQSVRVCCIDGASRAELRAIRDLKPVHNVDPRDSARDAWARRKATGRMIALTYRAVLK